MLTAFEITNLYLYGTKTLPANLPGDVVIRPPSTGSTNVTEDINDYMISGPGRFASPAFFDVIKLFFSPTSSGLAPGTYTEMQMRAEFGLEDALITLQQWAYDDGNDDYAERVYVWNTGAFEIDDRARFVIDANGDRYIENFGIIPFGDENFDFASNSLVSQLGNNWLEEHVDPSGVGEQVVINFSEETRILQRYEYSDYQADTQNITFANPLLLTSLNGKIESLVNSLINSGIKGYLDGDKPVIYGTDGDDHIEGDQTTTGVDLSSHEFIGQYTENGISYFAGAGNDVITAGDENDILNGGEDHDELYGNKGSDYLYGMDGNDTIIGGEGNDYLEGGKGNDVYWFSYGDGNDLIVDSFSGDNNRLGIEHEPGGSRVSIGELTRVEANSDGISAVNPTSKVYREVDAQGEKLNDTIYILGETELRIIIDGGAGGTITIQDFYQGDENNNNFGLVFNDNVEEFEEPEQSGSSYDVGDGYVPGLFTIDSEGNSNPVRIKRNFIHRDEDDDQAYISNLEIFYDVSVATGLFTNPFTGENYYGENFAHNIFEGGKKNDRLIGGVYGDSLLGREGDDYIEAGDGRPIESPADGNNYLEGGLGSDVLLGGLGVDFISGNSGHKFNNHNDLGREYIEEDKSSSDFISGGEGDDKLSGDEGDDTIFAGLGDDDVYGGMGEDILFGNEGEDIIFGDSRFERISFLSALDLSYYTIAAWNYITEEVSGVNYSDLIFGGDDTDLILGEIGNDVIEGGAGDDTIWGDSFEDKEEFDLKVLDDQGNVIFNHSDNYLALDSSLHGDDIIYGGEGNDDLRGNGGNDVLDGGEGDDYLRGDDDFLYGASKGLAGAEHGNDSLFGGEGNDFLSGGGGDDYLEGGDGDDSLVGDATRLAGESTIHLAGSFHGADTLYGNAGNDILNGGGGDDYISGGEDDDIIFGDGQYDDSQNSTQAWVSTSFHGSDQLFGDGGNDQIHGGDGDDYIDGGSGDDILVGSGGNDVLAGGVGDDQFYGDQGNDTYLIQGSDGVDQITDESGNNKLVLSGINVDTIQLQEIPGGAWLHFDASNRVFLWDSTFANLELYNSSVSAENLISKSDLIQDVTGDTSASDVVITGSRNDTIILGGFSDTAQGMGGNDLIDGGDGNDYLDGGDGDDTIFGGGGDDTVLGGRGNDQLEGGIGNDTYVFSLGDGRTGIDDSLGLNVLSFAGGISTSDVKISRGTNQTIVRYSAQESDVILMDTVTFDSISTFQFGSNFIPIAQFETLTTTEYQPSVGTTVINADNSSGTGNTIIFGDEVSSNNLNYTRNGNDLAINFVNLNGYALSSITVTNFFLLAAAGSNASNPYAEINLEFPNYFYSANPIGGAATVTNSAIYSAVTTGDQNDNTLLGTAGDDTIRAYGGDDGISGNGGYDTVIAGTGNDRISLYSPFTGSSSSGGLIISNLGDGIDEIFSDGSIDLRFGGGITSSDITAFVEASDPGNHDAETNTRDIEIYYSNQDALRIGNNTTIRSITFADGSILDSLDIFGNDDNNDISGTDLNDTIYAGKGIDSISSGAGDDYVELEGRAVVDGDTNKDNDFISFFPNADGEGNQIYGEFYQIPNPNNFFNEYSFSPRDLGRDAFNYIQYDYVSRVDGGAGNDTFVSSGTSFYNFAGRAGDDLYQIGYGGYFIDVGDELENPDSNFDGGNDVIEIGNGITLSDFEHVAGSGDYRIRKTQSAPSYYYSSGDFLRLELDGYSPADLLEGTNHESNQKVFTQNNNQIIIRGFENTNTIVRFSDGQELTIGELENIAVAEYDYQYSSLGIDETVVVGSDVVFDIDNLITQYGEDVYETTDTWEVISANGVAADFTYNNGQLAISQTNDKDGLLVLGMKTYDKHGYWDYIYAEVEYTHAIPRDDLFFVYSNQTTNFNIDQLLANDDIEVGRAYDVGVNIDSSYGELAYLPSSGTISYTPNDGYYYYDAFTYSIAADGEVYNAYVYIDTQTAVIENQPIVLDISDLTSDYPVYESLSIENVLNGTAAIDNQQGTVTFTPGADYTGDASFIFSIQITPTFSISREVHLDVLADNQPPIGFDDVVSTSVDTQIIIPVEDLTDNDIDADGDNLTITAVGNAINGVVTFNQQFELITFTPTTGFSGDASFEYSFTDGAASDTSVVTVIVGATNASPNSTDDVVATTESTAMTVTFASLLANDTDVDGDALTITAVANAVNGSVAIDSVNETITFTPTTNYNGPASFDYTISDGVATSTSTVDVSVTPVNDAPVSNNDSATTTESTAVTLTFASLLANDTDVDGDALTITAVANAVNGSVAIDSVNETITFTPTTNYNGPASFDYTISDGVATSTSTVDVSVTPVNDAPIANADAVNVDEDSQLVINVADLIANDSDADGDAFVITSVSNSQNGVTVLDIQAGTITFTPNANYNGPASFDYTINDGVASSNATVAVTVNSVNDSPAVNNDSVSTNQDSTLVIGFDELLANDSDVEGDTLTITNVNNASNGTVTIDAQARTITFMPTNGFNGVAAFDYLVSDGINSTISSVAITVNAAVTIDLTGAIFGTSNNDSIVGTSGNDVIVGGAGNDVLRSGYNGNDTYVFGLGDGQDFIDNYGSSNSQAGAQDVIAFQAGIAVSDIIASHDNDGLVLTNVTSGDEITVDRHFNTSGNYQIHGVAFADGTYWDTATIYSMMNISTSGDDSLEGMSGDDILSGGLGNDYLKGDGGNDTYVFAAGDGQDEINNYDNYNNLASANDVIAFQAGIAVSDIVASHDNDDLVLTNITTGDEIVVDRHFNTNGHYQIHDIAFADGTHWDTATINSMMNNATAGDDSIAGFSGDDILSGGLGNDYLKGRGGNDTYVFAAGDGQDVVANYDGNNNLASANDVIAFQAGIAVSDIVASHDNDDLVLTNITTGDEIVVDRHFNTNGHYQIHDIAFADGTHWDTATINSMMNIATAGDDSLVGFYGIDDTLAGGAGNDYLQGNGSSDTYVFGLGDGQDEIDNYDDYNPNVDNVDRLLLDNLNHDQLWFSRQGNDLQIDVVGTNDQVTVNNWYNSSQLYSLDEISTTSDNGILDYAEVDQLVNAMAQFDIPTGVGASIPQNQQDQLTPIITSTWMS